MKLRARWWMAVVAAGAQGCDDPKPCNASLQESESFTVEVLSKVDAELVERPSYIEEGTPSCGDIDGVEVGAQFAVELDKREEHGPSGSACYDYVCPLDFPSGASGSSARVGRYGGTRFVCYNGEAQLSVGASCSAQRFVTLTQEGKADSIYAEPYADGTSPVRLTRAMVVHENVACSEPPEGFPNALSTPSYFCYDQWNVQLTPSKKK